MPFFLAHIIVSPSTFITSFDVTVKLWVVDQFGWVIEEEWRCYIVHVTLLKRGRVGDGPAVDALCVTSSFAPRDVTSSHQGVGDVETHAGARFRLVGAGIWKRGRSHYINNNSTRESSFAGPYFRVSCCVWYFLMRTTYRELFVIALLFLWIDFQGFSSQDLGLLPRVLSDGFSTGNVISEDTVTGGIAMRIGCPGFKARLGHTVLSICGSRSSYLAVM